MCADDTKVIQGSDHCPVYAIISDDVEFNSKKVSIKDIMSPPGTFECGVRLKEWSVKDLPPFSGKLLPEFDKRRTIKDMFNKKPVENTAESSDMGFDAEQGSTLPASPGQARQAPDVATSTELATQSIISSQVSDVENSRVKKRPTANTYVTTCKRSKSSTTSTMLNLTNAGQRSLRGFFAPKTQKSPGVASSEIVSNAPPCRSTTPVETHYGMADVIGPPTSLTTTTVMARSPSPFMDSSPVSAEVFDPIVSKDSWSKLFTKPVAPRCDHGEPCKIMKTKKTGFNCGREFWMCQR